MWENQLGSYSSPARDDDGLDVLMAFVDMEKSKTF